MPKKENGLIVDQNGTKEWYLNGQLHREDGPAVEWLNGSMFWYLNDKPHRTDGPAREWSTGIKEWYLNGQRHRTDGPAQWVNESKAWWFLNGNLLTDEEVKIFEYLQTCPEKELMEYAGTIFAPILKQRLK
jgi:hypothetical protein